MELMSSLSIFVTNQLARVFRRYKSPAPARTLPPPGPLFDIGLYTCMRIREHIVDAGCGLWTGPAGLFEKDDFAFGTIEILNQCCESNGFVIIGGGHTSALVNTRKS